MTQPTALARRDILRAAAASAAAVALPCTSHAADDKILIGYWPIASGLPLYVGLERGILKATGLQVEGAKIAIASFGAMLIVLFNSAYGVMNAKKTRVMAAQIMGVSKWHVFKDVLLMESLAQTFVGLRSAVSMALVIVIVAEMFIGSETGLGHRIIDAQQVFNVKDMYTSILITGALGYGLNLVFLLAEKKLIHWSGKA